MHFSPNLHKIMFCPQYKGMAAEEERAWSLDCCHAVLTCDLSLKDNVWKILKQKNWNEKLRVFSS